MIEQDDVCLYITEACNSNCIMCPMSLDSRKRGNRFTSEQWNRIQTEIPRDTPHITITGGEPFLEYKSLLPAIRFISSSFPMTDVLILTNGRALAIPSIFDELAPLLTGQFCLAIPIHAPSAKIHDQITQSNGSFSQTISALHKLKHTNAKIEIRIVGHKLNLHLIGDTVRMLIDSDLRIDTINIIAMEMTGCAARNRNDLWVPYDELCRASRSGIIYAVQHETPVGLYNFPLCSVPNDLWALVKNSITPSKVRYSDKCAECKERNACGGFFFSTLYLGLGKAIPFYR